MVAPTMNKAIVTRMMYGASTIAARRSLRPNTMIRCGSHTVTLAPNLASSGTQPKAPS